MVDVVSQNTATVALINSLAARESACTALMNSFDAKSATVAVMQSYADCVDFMHPDDLTHMEQIVLKGVIILGFIGSAVGGRIAYKSDGVSWIPLGILVGSSMSILATCFLAVALKGLLYVIGVKL